MRNKDDIFDIIATELCRRVGAKYPPPEGTKIAPTDYEWTEAEENDFREWMKKYLKTVPGFKRMGARYVKREIGFFIFQYGWKTR